MLNLPITLRDSISTIREWRNPFGVINSPSMENVGAKIRKAREALGLSRRELLEAAGLGESPPSRLANYEAGTREPTLGDLERLAAGLKLSLFELLQYGNGEITMIIDESHRSLFEIWDGMEPEEQGLWLKRGNQILKSRNSDDEEEPATHKDGDRGKKSTPAGVKNAKRMSHKP